MYSVSYETLYVWRIEGAGNELSPLKRVLGVVQSK
jgi:hypothetical protein